jgi:hypothetical protein
MVGVTNSVDFESDDRVRVATRESGGAAANKPFVLSVFC